MILPGGPYGIYVATPPIDFRKQPAGLSPIVQEVLGRDPFSGAIFVFRSKRGNQLKCLVWDQTGLAFGAALGPVARSPLTLREAGGRCLAVAQAV